MTVDWITLGINAAASLLLGFLTARWLFTPSVPLWVRAGPGPGFPGSFSTFSALALHLDQLLAAGLPVAFALYLLLSMGPWTPCRSRARGGAVCLISSAPPARRT